jgi:NNP family nitrate/nitrite transporter-like MFS transporter
MVKLIVFTLPLTGSLALLVFKVQQLGYIGQTMSIAAYALIAGGTFYQIAQVLKVNLPVLKKGVPKDDRYPFNSVVALSLAYVASFGAEMAVVSILPLFFELTYRLSPTSAGLIASCFSFANLIARPMGGVISDQMKNRKGILVVTLLGIAVGFVAMSFIDSSLSIGSAVTVTVLCSLFVSGSMGANFAMIPLLKRRLTGQISGMVGAYGNMGALVYLTIYSFVDTQTFFLILAAGAFVSFLVCYLFLQEPKAALAGEYYLSSVDRDIEGEAILGNTVLDEEKFTPTIASGEGRVRMEVGSNLSEHRSLTVGPMGPSRPAWEGRVQMMVSLSD